MIIQGKKIWLNKQFIPAQIEINNEKITSIHSYKQNKFDIDYGNYKILPGFIDIHDHGYLGKDANHASFDYLKKWASYLPQEGITAFLPTTSTTFSKDLYNSFKVLGDFANENINYTGAEILGIHIEGPMISKKYRGSHNPDLIIKPDVNEIKKWQKLTKNHIRMLTLAVENDENFQVIEYCKKNNIVVSIGHSGATYEEAKLAVEKGAKSFTHTFNGMLGLHHREPGTVGAAMDIENTYAEIIADGIHVSYPVIRILGKLKGPEHLITITDSIWAKGCEPGVYPRPEKGVNVIIDKNNIVRLETGSLAGSTNKLNRMVYNLIHSAYLPEATAINSVTINPAKLLNIDNTYGEIKENFYANLTIVDDDYNIQATFIKGKCVFKK